MEKYDCKVILCGPGVGKSYLAERDNRFVDVDEIKSSLHMPFKHNAFILINFIIDKLHMIHVWTFVLFISKNCAEIYLCFKC